MPIISGGGGSGAAGGVGAATLVYRFTVTGADKLTIDTGVDVPQAGTNDWTNGDLLEAWLYARTDEATNESQVNLTFNNDTTAAHYLGGRIRANNTALTQVGQSGANIASQVAGNTASAASFTGTRITIPNYMGTVANKPFEIVQELGDTTAASSDYWVFAGSYVSTVAISRMAVVCNTGTAKFKVGTQLLVYKRLAS